MHPAPRALPVLPIGTGLGVHIGWQPVSYLFDMGFTRDVWMHRIDVAHAAQRQPAARVDVGAAQFLGGVLLSNRLARFDGKAEGKSIRKLKAHNGMRDPWRTPVVDGEIDAAILGDAAEQREGAVETGHEGRDRAGGSVDAADGGAASVPQALLEEVGPEVPCVEPHVLGEAGTHHAADRNRRQALELRAVTVEAREEQRDADAGLLKPRQYVPAERVLDPANAMIVSEETHRDLEPGLRRELAEHPDLGDDRGRRGGRHY